MEQALLATHTAFLGRLLAIHISGGTADVQPLTMPKALGKKAVVPAPLIGIPVLANARYTLAYGPGCSAEGGLGSHVVLEPIRAGAIVLCVVCDRDISQARRGQMAQPPAGHHEIKDSIVVGVLA